MDLTEALINLLVAILIAATPTLVLVLRHYLGALEGKIKAEIGVEKFDLLVNFTSVLIRTAEQVFDLGDNEAKKQYVVDRVMSFAQANGIEVTQEQIEDIIEGILHEWQRDFSS